jgi:hypothetical protein
LNETDEKLIEFIADYKVNRKPEINYYPAYVKREEKTQKIPYKTSVDSPNSILRKAFKNQLGGMGEINDYAP